MTTIRALTVQQPWAWAIVNGDKPTENRSQAWSYRGPLLIHSGTRWSERGGNSPLIRQAFTVTNHGYKGGNVPEWLFTAAAAEGIPGTAMGAIIGVADLASAHPDAGCCRPWGESAYTEHGGRERRTVTHLVLENPRALPEPIACRGALGLWKPPPDIVEQLHHAGFLPVPAGGDR